LTVQTFICKFKLTGERKKRSRPLTSEELTAMLTAIAHPLRLRIIAELAGGRVHVSELARRLGMSRPLLYMHLDRLEKAGLVTGHLELSDDGKAMKYFELVPFELRVTAETVIGALAADYDHDHQIALEMEESKDE
jgi:DNA-binding transcriptional ArsR family regulator